MTLAALSDSQKSQGKAVCGHCGEPSGGLWGLFDDVHGPESIAAGIALRRRINDLRSVPCDTQRRRRPAQVRGVAGVKESFGENYANRVA